jgi:hypothetical protein
MFESFEKRLVLVKVDAEEEVRHRNQEIETIWKAFACENWSFRFLDEGFNQTFENNVGFA